VGPAQENNNADLHGIRIQNADPDPGGVKSAKIKGVNETKMTDNSSLEVNLVCKTIFETTTLVLND
jgi:hypothetical protein